VAPATLRTWDRRYGLGPQGHARGSWRGYTAADLCRLEAMRSLVLDGVAPALAAHLALTRPVPRTAPPPAVPFSLPPDVRAAAVPAAGSGAIGATIPGVLPPEPCAGHGGRVLALPGAGADLRGVARAAMALDSRSVCAALQRSLDERGVVATWEELLRPLLRALGQRWATRGRDIEVEHLLSECALGALRSWAAGLPEPQPGRLLLLTCVQDEWHALPLQVLATALHERGVPAEVLGPALPHDALAGAVCRLGPAAVLLWAQMRGRGCPEALDALPRQRPSPAVYVGGAGWEPAALPPHVGHLPDLRTAVEALVPLAR
jgi:hypothetical protein